MASESIAHSASWAIDSEPIQALGIIVKYTHVAFWSLLNYTEGDFAIDAD